MSKNLQGGKASSCAKQEEAIWEKSKEKGCQEKSHLFILCTVISKGTVKARKRTVCKWHLFLYGWSEALSSLSYLFPHNSYIIAQVCCTFTVKLFQLFCVCACHEAIALTKQVISYLSRNRVSTTKQKLPFSPFFSLHFHHWEPFFKQRFTLLAAVKHLPFQFQQFTRSLRASHAYNVIKWQHSAFRFQSDKLSNEYKTFFFQC